MAAYRRLSEEGVRIPIPALSHCGRDLSPGAKPSIQWPDGRIQAGTATP